MLQKISDRIRHFFHVVSNIRPIVWICLYIILVPIFALIYWWLPDSQFRIPEGGSPAFGSWLYYSIVTISTLGFGDYTPAHGWAQAVTAIEVVCGLSVFGFFLNSVGSMKAFPPRLYSSQGSTSYELRRSIIRWRSFSLPGTGACTEKVRAVCPSISPMVWMVLPTGTGMGGSVPKGMVYFPFFFSISSWSL